MTPEERAEKIMADWVGPYEPPTGYQSLCWGIAQALRECRIDAREEAAAALKKTAFKMGEQGRHVDWGNWVNASDVVLALEEGDTPEGESCPRGNP